MLAFIGNNFLQDCNTGSVTQCFELFAVLGDVPSLVNFQTAECEVSAADSIRQRISLT
jgi:hypothetical protein